MDLGWSLTSPAYQECCESMGTVQDDGQAVTFAAYDGREWELEGTQSLTLAGTGQVLTLIRERPWSTAIALNGHPHVVVPVCAVCLSLPWAVNTTSNNNIVLWVAERNALRLRHRRRATWSSCTDATSWTSTYGPRAATTPPSPGPWRKSF